MIIRCLVTVALALLLLTPVDRTASAQEADAGGEVTVQRVWVGMEPDFYAGHPSPDGRYVSDIHWDSGDLAVIDLVSGDLERVWIKESGWEETSWAESSVFSPDGRRIAYVWWTVGTEDDPEYNGYSIHTIKLDGGEPEVLVPTGVGEYYLLDEWSADGRYILGKVYGPAGIGALAKEQLVRIRVSDGELEPIWEMRTGDFWRGPDRAAFSPDGGHVAFDILPGPDDHDLYVIATTGGDPRPVLEGQADDRLLGWLPDGSGLLFYSDRNATSGMWFLPLDSALRPGEPRLLKPDVWRAQSLGFSRDAYLYGVVVESRQVYTGAIDVAIGGYLASVGPVQEASQGVSLNGEFSPDGRYLAYATRSPEGTFMKNHAVVVRAVGGDDLRIFAADVQRVPIG
ncbi:MAG: PD40 domain-containing protein, partial [Gemmatimonadetes bacterium]|nr:PD40 domain-containing protein [Gemmatimonadota bacterium]